MRPLVQGATWRVEPDWRGALQLVSAFARCAVRQPIIAPHGFALRPSRSLKLSPVPLQVAELLLRSLAERGTYDQPDFCSRLSALLDTLDGTPYCVVDGRTNCEPGYQEMFTLHARRAVWRLVCTCRCIAHEDI